ncbi:MAG: cation diffusion facilitator CzcD-associated flavoprotein CzcO [Candidatus Azotimanducaceae bacterium]|jgi:cation diffusion facilitator CzcD-associated flavoprotein CzcO
MNTDEQYFETVIIGTGFSGLLAAIRLKKKGADDFVLLERESEIGGTWKNNSYPGAEVDVPTGLYSFSFTNYKFKKRYAPQSELLEYTNDIIDQFDLRKSTRANQDVTKVTYDEVGYLWHVEVASGERYTTRFIVDTSGVLANPHTPYIQGAESFEGDVFHTAEWGHNVSYEGKNVGVIGSGCSATQVVPALSNKPL